MRIVEVCAHLERFDTMPLDNDFVEGRAEIRKKDSCFFLEIDAKCKFFPYDYQRMFDKNKAISVTLEFGGFKKALLQNTINPFWVGPEFLSGSTAFNGECQALLMKCGGIYICVLPIVCKDFKANITSSNKKNCFTVNISRNASGCDNIKGTVAVIVENENPYTAVAEAFKNAVDMGLIITSLKQDKEYPAVMEKLGWCTWNAFYHDVTEQRIIDKLEEFKKKDIPVKWILIDDGWSDYKDMKLGSIYEDKEKFPSGLRCLVDRLKTEYKLEAVGIWHAMTGYWQGTEKTFEHTIDGNVNTRIPSGYEFYSKWHNYLREQGIDFIKVDAQGNIPEFLKGRDNSLEKIIDIQSGLERSASENFDFMINCMGMTSINMLNRENSVMVRNSDDFFPNKENAIVDHILQNAYNAVFNDNLYYCDYDMWWSNHIEAEQNAALRAISGGPFYISDAVGESCGDIINKFVDPEGRILRYDNAAKPTVDCLFGFDKVLKVFNTQGKNGVIAVFTFDEEGTVKISADDFGGSGEYTIIEVFSGEKRHLGLNEYINVTLDAHSVKMYKFYIQK